MGEQFSIQAFIFVIILLIYLLTSHIIQTKQVPYIHESTIAIIMGIFTAVFAKYGLNKEIQFSNQLFFAIILPPIIFSAGYNVKQSSFFQYVKIIGILGIVGALVGYICLTSFIYVINMYIFKALTFKEVMLLSCVLSATDTVTSMSLVKRNKFPVLSSILFGQAIINDAVAIILFHAISQITISQQDPFTLYTLLYITFDFTYMFIFSVAFGIVTGLGLSYLFKKLESFVKYPIKQVSLILLNGYFTYLLGELLGLSGVIGLFTCAIIMGHYCYMNISGESKKGTGLAFQTVSYIAQAFIFAYLGASILSIQGKWQAIIMSIIILAILPVIRIIIVYMLPLFYKLRKIQYPLQDKQIKMSWFSGMVRGAIAFALCLQIQGKGRKYIVTIVVVIVMITTLFSSTMVKKFKKYIGLSGIQTNYKQDQLLTNSNNTIPSLKNMLSSQQQIDKNKNNKTHRNPIRNSKSNERYQDAQQQKQSSRPLGNNQNNFQQFQEKYLKPIFSKNNRSMQINYELDQQKNIDKKGKDMNSKQIYGNMQDL